MVLFVRWYEAGNVIEGATRSDLDLIGIKRDLHGKAISCEATNEVGSSNQSYTLTIECEYTTMVLFLSLSSSW